MNHTFNICVPILNQHEQTREMLINFCSMADNPKSFHWVLIDNGSSPPLEEFLRTTELSESIRSSISIISYPQNIGLTKALNAGYHFICDDPALNCAYIFFSHNDVLMDEKGWDTKLCDFLSKKTGVGVVGFGGARQIGMKGLYTDPYHISQLRRRDFISDMREAEVHGNRMKTNFEPIAVLDGFTLIVSMELLRETGGFDEINYPIHHMYDIDICLEALRRWRMNYVLNIKCHHIGAATSANKDYNAWSKPHGGDDGIHAAAHVKFYKKWRGFIPLRVTASWSPLHIAGRGMQTHVFCNTNAKGKSTIKLNYNYQIHNNGKAKNVNLKEIKKTIESFGSDNRKMFGGKFEGGIHLQQVIDEISPCIFDLLSQNRSFENFLEIGSAAGGNTFLFNHFFNFKKTVIIDNNQHPKHHLRPETLKAIKPIEFGGDSHSSEALHFANNQNLKYDIMFIDGDHTYEGVKKDTEMYLHLLNENGFVIYHDTIACPEEVGKHFNELKNSNRYGLTFFNEYITKKFKRACGIGVLQKISVENSSN